MVKKFPLFHSMGNAIYCGLGISQSGAKAGHGPKLSWVRVTLRIYGNWRCHATCQQIVVKRGNLKLLFVNLQDKTGLCHYVVSVRYKFDGMSPCNIAGTTHLIQTSERKTTSHVIRQMTTAKNSNGSHTNTHSHSQHSS